MTIHIDMMMAWMISFRSTLHTYHHTHQTWIDWYKFGPVISVTHLECYVDDLPPHPGQVPPLHGRGPQHVPEVRPGHMGGSVRLNGNLGTRKRDIYRVA